MVEGFRDTLTLGGFYPHYWPRSNRNMRPKEPCKGGFGETKSVAKMPSRPFSHAPSLKVGLRKEREREREKGKIGSGTRKLLTPEVFSLMNNFSGTREMLVPEDLTVRTGKVQWSVRRPRDLEISSELNGGANVDKH
jgi:hypothetical protein